ncbi:hypothetical protein CFP56_033138 [Quercus suber]|uniref:Uncharacterized protein n=1 Tax=Quercus suber TaxID=58331 RepID=A0AAW0JFA5_QUESU
MVLRRQQQRRRQCCGNDKITTKLILPKKIFKPNKLLVNANFHFSKLELKPNGMILSVLTKESGPSQATERPALIPCGLKLQKSHLNRIF